jgi:hypothetical protein
MVDQWCFMCGRGEDEAAKEETEMRQKCGCSRVGGLPC